MSGRVTDLLGNPIPEVIIYFHSDYYYLEPYQSCEDGWWSEWGLTGQSVTIIPEKDGYTFEPQSITVEGSREDINFVGRKKDKIEVGQMLRDGVILMFLIGLALCGNSQATLFGLLILQYQLKVALLAKTKLRV